MDYVTIPKDFLWSIAPLDDAERGRLFTAMLIYADTGGDPPMEGNERFLWPSAKLHIERGRDLICRTE